MTTTMSQELATREQNNGAVTTTFSMVPRNLEEAMKFADIMAKSDLVPKDYRGKPGNILVAMQKGFEVGLSPMAALETIAVINGRASLWGDGLLAIVMSHPAYEWHTETFHEATMTATFTIKRKGHPPHVSTFSKADAIQAKTIEWVDNKQVKKSLWEKDTYQSYPKRMLPARARGFGCRDKFPDALKGMIAAEEALDIPDASPEPFPAPAAPAPLETLKAKLAAHLADETVKPESTITTAPSEESASAGCGSNETPEAPAYFDHRQKIFDATTIEEAQAARREAFNDARLTKVEHDILDKALSERTKFLKGKP
jgi:hypothetical protein